MKKEEWEIVPFSEAIQILGGGTPKTTTLEYWGGNIPWLSVVDFNNGFRHVFDTEKKITSKGLEESSTALLNAGDIIVSARGTVGALAQLGRPMAFNQSCYGIRAKSDVACTDFIYYALRLAVEDMKRVAHGAVFSTITRQTFDLLTLRLPPLPIQHRIAEVLGSLDDKIELNRQMNATLEKMAQAIFRAWFVDFESGMGAPPMCMDGSAPSNPSTAHGQGAHATSVRGLPEGWEIRSLDQIANFLNGLALQKYPPGDGPTLPVIKIAQLRKGDTEGADRCNTELASQYIVLDGDVLFSWSGSLEVELWCGGVGALNQHLFKVTSSEFPKWFYYMWTLHHLGDFRLIAADKATTMGHIQRRHLTEAQVVVPSADRLATMTQTMGPIVEQIISNRIQSRTLAALRDTLLPKLLSGEMTP